MANNSNIQLMSLMKIFCPNNGNVMSNNNNVIQYNV